MSFSEYLTNEIHKQHINLSTYAWNIIDSDMALFSIGTNKLSLSGFLNRIIHCYNDISPSNLSKSYGLRKHFYINSLSSIDNSLLNNKYTDTVLKRFMDDYESQLEKQFMSFPKDEGRKFRLNNESFKTISDMPENGINCKVYIKPGAYLKALFETYCRLSFVERERIYFADSIYTIENAIDRNCLVNLKLSNNCEYNLIPYIITTDTSSSFNYIVGYSAPIDTNNYVSASFRLSRIVDIKCCYNIAASLSSEDKTKINSSIRSKGVQFMLNDTITATIKFTDSGLVKYNSMQQLRPSYETNLGNNVYSFNATKERLMFYFFKFGEDVEILSPPELRKSFIEMYKRAYEVYCK